MSYFHHFHARSLSNKSKENGIQKLKVYTTVENQRIKPLTGSCSLGPDAFGDSDRT